MFTLEHEIIRLLREKGLSLGITESATGGLISHLITNVPGCSDVYKGSVTAYANVTKISVLSVNTETLAKYGAVSSQVAEEMALGGRLLLAVDICISDTGIAGPGGATSEKPVGLFYIGLAHGLTSYSRQHIFHGNREENKYRAARTSLEWLKSHLLDLNQM